MSDLHIVLEVSSTAKATPKAERASLEAGTTMADRRHHEGAWYDITAERLVQVKAVLLTPDIATKRRFGPKKRST